MGTNSTIAALDYCPMSESFVYRKWQISVSVLIMHSIADRNVTGKVMSSTVVLILGPSSDCIEICVPSPVSVLRSLCWKTLHTDSVAAAKPFSCYNAPESFSRL